jgi:Zn-finger nucleic acid-binding protein
MDAQTLNCPMCGAPAASDETRCEHCGARLATVACPSCFGMIFLGSKFCAHCGAKVERAEASDETPKLCPRCRVQLDAIALGPATLHECPRCEGLWIDVETFTEICADREKQAAVLGGAQPAHAPATLDFNLDDVHYVPCPACGALMNRVNFAHTSGVIVDVCKGHGTWFDRDELRRIVEFIRDGGLERARQRERDQWASEKRLHDLGPAGGGLAPMMSEDFDSSQTSRVFAVLEYLVLIGAALVRLLVK